MKQSNIFQSKISNKVLAVIAATSIFFMAHPVCAQAQQRGLTNAKKVLDEFKKQLDIIIPIAAAIILLCLAIGYAGRYIEKDTFVRWSVGIIIAGSAVELANMLFKAN
ncbi:VirB2 family type IV secretion system major pilin TrwL [Bartonella henselae]|uniref:VirB2 family type IV secretion system major pilin TrwL n=1 Tax=Bartonella henselae TaxID=38323 RepID=UPI00095E4A82|nr:VirB2 family type IV secretion system major pilin TrwL [Bartonella henselae]OLL55921.1 conjugal transfer protein [Bartonella henselae]OLL56038.1 conjugal transfer protein [Bartonella henselae]UJM32342.1 VirB2 family type IV secretion system major pilin TrwL [Bartonella henselae]